MSAAVSSTERPSSSRRSAMCSMDSVSYTHLPLFFLTSPAAGKRKKQRLSSLLFCACDMYFRLRITETLHAFGSRLRLLAERNGEVYAVLGRECVQSDEELLSLGCVLAADDLVPVSYTHLLIGKTPFCEKSEECRVQSEETRGISALHSSISTLD